MENPGPMGDQEGANHKDILLNMYNHHTVAGRHHENQRATMTNLLVIISAGIIGLITFDNQLHILDLPLSLFLMICGALGSLFSRKHYERSVSHFALAAEYRKRLEDTFVPISSDKFRKDVQKAQEERFPYLHKLDLWLFWVLLHIIIAASGLILTVLILLNHYL